MPLLSKILFQTLKYLRNAVRSHFWILYHALDPIKNVDKLQSIDKLRIGNTQINSQYIFPFCVASFSLIDSLWILYQADFRYSQVEPAQLLSQLIAPEAYWQQGDVVIANAIWMETLLYGLLLGDSMLPPQYQMLLTTDPQRRRSSLQFISDNQPWRNKSQVERLCRFRRKARRFFDVLMVCCLAQIEAFCVGNFVLKWNGTGRHCLMAAVVPLFFFYANFSNLFMLFYFILTARYIQFKQSFKRAKLNRLMQKFHSLRNREIGFLQLKFNLLRLEIVDLYNEISAYNRFWSKYLTAYFVVYIMETCYMAYAFFFIRAGNGFIRWFFIFFAVEFAAILLLVTYESSVIVYQNMKTFRKQLKFNRFYQLVHHRVRVIDIIKMDTMASNQRFVGRIAFTLTNGYRIDSKMFEMIFSYISVLFMMIMRDNY